MTSTRNLRVSIAVVAVIPVLVLAVPTTSYSATNWLDSHISVSSITRNSDGSFHVSYNTTSSIDSIVPVNFVLKFPASYRLSYSQTHRPSGTVGAHAFNFAAPPKVFGKVEVHLTLSTQYPEDKVWRRLNMLETHVARRTVTSADVTAQKVSFMIVGFELDLLGLPGVQKVWSTANQIYADYTNVMSYASSTGMTCPSTLKAGQYIEVTSTYTSLSGTQVRLDETVKKWATVTRYNNHEAPGCIQTASYVYG